MFRTIKLTLSVMVLGILMTAVSCSKDNPLYSCDPEIEAWTKANIAAYANASRAEFVQLSMSRQRAVFRGISGETKVSLWREKFTDIIMRDESLSDDEKQDLEALFAFLEPRHYETKDGAKEFKRYMKEWKAKMIDVYGWDDEKFFWNLETLMTKEELTKAIIAEGMESLRVSTRGESSDEDCDCTSDNYCRFTQGGSECGRGESHCKVTNAGCGLMGTSKCDGLCD